MVNPWSQKSHHNNVAAHWPIGYKTPILIFFTGYEGSVTFNEWLPSNFFYFYDSDSDVKTPTPQNWEVM